ncbi:Lipoate synthase [gamma proteobacterium IMCC2047]|nr:Lipoate synthase [gamma proteobacterium IMCC2047]
MSNSQEGNKTPSVKRKRVEAGVKMRGADKVDRIPVKVVPSEKPQRKPDWIRVRMSSSPQVAKIKKLLRKNKLASVCEEAACPNLSECFSHGTATFMIMGEVCTRRCPFCDVAHGRPLPLDVDEPRHLAQAIADLQLSYVVITSVDRDDLRDGGAAHFADCIRETRQLLPTIKIEILVPDFRGRMDVALDELAAAPADVFNHNLESVPRLYRKIRPGSDYQWSLTLLKKHKQRQPQVLTKSGLMVGLGETAEEIYQVMSDLREHDVDMITLGQYLQPSLNHLPVERFVHPDEFAEYAERARAMGFKSVASGPLVRSSYHADRQALGETIE